MKIEIEIEVEVVEDRDRGEEEGREEPTVSQRRREIGLRRVSIVRRMQVCTQASTRARCVL
jgi:hypothetical protein